MMTPASQKNKQVTAQFYNSKDGLYHLAEYVPYERPPIAYLCGKTGNFSPSLSSYKRPLCGQCWSLGAPDIKKEAQ